MKNHRMSICKHRKKSIICAPVVVVAVTVILLLLSSSGSYSEAAPPSYYKDENGDILPVPVGAIQFTSGMTAMSGGNWYYIDSTFTAGTITVTGSAFLIILDGCALTVTAINVSAGASFSIYPGSHTETILNTGELRASGKVITLYSGSELVNVSNIIRTASSTDYSGCVDVLAFTATINNAEGGTISAIRWGISLRPGGAIITNFGIMQVSGSGDSDAAIYTFATSTAMITNNANGKILGGYNGTRFLSGVTVENYGEISGTMYGVYFSNNGVMTINNYSGGVIKGTSGTNATGVRSGGAGINVTNYHGAEISGTGYGITLQAGGTVDNSGLIKGNVHGIYPSNVNTAVITNNSSGQITGTNNGIYLHAGGTIYNYGIVKGEGGTAIMANAGSTVFTNGGTTDGSVTLANAVNTVKFIAGSKINGNFSIGTGSSSLSFEGALDSSLIYSKVSGVSNIGAATTTVSFGSDWVAPYSFLHPGVKIILIGGGTMAVSTAPRNNTLAVGPYIFDILIDANRLIATTPIIEILLKDADTSASLDESNPYIFADKTQGYTPSVLNVVVSNIGDGGNTGALDISISGLHLNVFVVSPDHISGIDEGGSYNFTVMPVAGLAPGTYTATVTVGPDAGSTKILNTISFDISFTVNPVIPVSGDKEYRITATADGGSTINPSGVSIVTVGGNKTIFFSAKAGFTISEVRIDGLLLLTKAQIDLGQFTFKNVMADHTIDVKTTTGYAGGDPEDPPGGGTGDDDGGTVDDSSTDSNRDLSIWVLGILLIVVLSMLIWFLLFYRRKYDVIKVESSLKIVGKDKVRRKSKYRFEVEGMPGTVSYKIGEDGEWKPISKNVKGEFVIPRGEITDNVTIEAQ